MPDLNHENLSKENMIKLSKSSISDLEKQEVARVLDCEFLGMGAEVVKFEKELSDFFGRPAVCVTNGTAALHLALQASGIGVGDEVLVQSLTYLASFQAISATGAAPVSCDVKKDTLTIDWRDAEKRLTSRTKAIMPMHYAGGVGDIDDVYRFAEQNGLRVIEDAAHAFGSSHNKKLVGSFGDVACFSFDGIKNITSGEGGCIVSDDEDLLNLVRDARLLGVVGDSSKRKKGERSWFPNVLMQGWRYHMSDIMATIGSVQLSRFTQFQEKRCILLKRYLENLEGEEGVCPIQYSLGSVVPHIFCVKLSSSIDRTRLRESMLENGIQTGVHYFPNHQLKFYFNNDIEPLRVTESVATQLLSLPMHVDLSLNEVDYICSALKRAIKQSEHT
jgi:dTDP-4-amino-4,6-dideoxygalactose transaminase